ncbi:C40 family peptidase [Secundilactobacillus oryzae]|nr:NlpC/P60 family protein [Secundilactobacillus oryzae]
MHRKKFWGVLIGVVVVLGLILVGGRLLTDLMGKPTVVSEVSNKIAPNHVFQTYKYPYKLKVTNRKAKLYSGPQGTPGVRTFGSVKSLNLSNNIVGKQRKDLNNKRYEGYIQFSQHHHSYWISCQDVDFRDLNTLKSTNPQVEKAITTGLSLVGHSKYNLGGGRNLTDIQRKSFDCSSFIRYCYSKAGVDVGSLDSVTTFKLINEGTAVKFSNMQRGDIFFFSNAKQGTNYHVAIYLGDNLFLHDAPTSDTHGVAVSTLYHKNWLSAVNGSVRRLA